MSKYFQALERAERERALQRPRAQEDQAEGAPKAQAARRPADPPATQRPARTGHQDSRLPLEPRGKTPDGVDPHLVSLLARTTFEAEQYRTICHSIEQMHREAGLSVVAVSSPAVGDGKTTTTINLAGALTQTPGTSVLLVDLDLRRPSVSSLLGLSHPGSRGLVDVISDSDLSLDEVMTQYPPFNLTILPAGRSSATPHEVLKSPRLGELLEEARRRYDYVVLDTPPLIPFSDCRLLERWIDGFLMVVAAHKTPRKLVEEALNVVDPAKMAGLIFNKDDRPVFGYYSHYTYSPSANGDRPRWLGRTVKKVGRSLWRRRASH